ncbi:MAG: four helix bundle protein [Gammaproteobacteria bacterium]|nr:four helix bundle protein [Gammaproteobacteria bacterium]
MDALSELNVWRRSKSLAVNIYRAMSVCRDRAFKEQITRAAVSIPSNIAEGYERSSRKEFARYLQIARGSCAELRTQIQIGQDIGYFSKEHGDNLLKEALELTKMMQALINRCRASSQQ